MFTMYAHIQAVVRTPLVLEKEGEGGRGREREGEGRREGWRDGGQEGGSDGGRVGGMERGRVGEMERGRGGKEGGRERGREGIETLLLCPSVDTKTEDGELLSVNQFSTFIVGAGGFGGKRSSPHVKVGVHTPTVAVCIHY